MESGPDHLAAFEADRLVHRSPSGWEPGRGALIASELVVGALAGIGYEKTEGNRRERTHDDNRTAVVDLLIPGYTSRFRSNHTVGSTTTTEVPGLAEAFQRQAVEVRQTPSGGEVFQILQAEVGDEGRSLPAITSGCSDEEAAQRQTRIRALLAALKP